MKFSQLDGLNLISQNPLLLLRKNESRFLTSPLRINVRGHLSLLAWSNPNGPPSSQFPPSSAPDRKPPIIDNIFIHRLAMANQNPRPNPKNPLWFFSFHFPHLRTASSQLHPTKATVNWPKNEMIGKWWWWWWSWSAGNRLQVENWKKIFWREMDECGERGIWSAVGRHWGGGFCRPSSSFISDHLLPTGSRFILFPANTTELAAFWPGWGINGWTWGLGPSAARLFEAVGPRRVRGPKGPRNSAWNARRKSLGPCPFLHRCTAPLFLDWTCPMQCIAHKSLELFVVRAWNGMGQQPVFLIPNWSRF